MGFLSAIADWLAKLWNRLSRTLGRSNPRLEQSHVAPGTQKINRFCIHHFWNL